MLCHGAEFYPKAKMESSWNKTSVFLGNDQQVFPEQLRAHKNSRNKCMGLPTDFNKKMQQTKLHSSHLIKAEVPTNSLLLNITNARNAGTKMHQHD